LAISSAQRETHRSVKKAERNKQAGSALKTFITKANKAIAGGVADRTEAEAAAIRALDKAAQKGIVHPNNAARRKSRLMKRLHGAQAAAGSSSRK
jgi:small subunit ribosomal protein S20